ncbi:hypothetical protein KY306_00925 [Candidatus Woesearchaeota archaeon]|nr:hypothetical protein [Candidatus Woesearchaeota archaeon]
MNEQQAVEGLTKALIKSGTGYEINKSKEIAQIVYKVIAEHLGSAPADTDRWKGEKTCLQKDLGLDSLDFVELAMGVEDELDMSFPEKTEKRYWDEGKTLVLDILQLSYKLRYN